MAVKLLSNILKILARLTIRRYRPQIIGITGSAGKTSAKEAIYAILSKKESTRKTSANFNNELGMPLSILGEWDTITKPVWFFWLRVLCISCVRLLYVAGGYPKTLVLEYGADRPGDIEKLCDIAKPDIAVISAIGSVPVHVENYPGGIESVFREKIRLIQALNVSCTAILNADDPYFKKMCERTRAHIRSFGCAQHADIRITNFTHVRGKDGSLEGIACKIQHKNTIVPIIIPNAFSISHAYAVACAIAVALEEDIDIKESATYIRSYHPVQGRSTLIRGIKHTQLIDESYNSSPLALETALRTLTLITPRRRVAVLGDMLELGDHTLQAHERAGEQVVEAVDILITVGMRAKFIAYKAREKGMKQEQVFICETADEAGKKLQELMREGDIILIKGSHSIGLEKVVEEVKEI